MINVIGDIPKNINKENKQSVIKIFAFAFQKNFNKIQLKKYNNIEAYLTSLAKDIKTNDKEKMWCLLALYVLRDFSISYKLHSIEDSINNLIDLIDCIKPQNMIDIINEIAILFLILRKHTLIISPSQNLKEEGFLRDVWLKTFNVIDEILNDDDIILSNFSNYYNLLDKNNSFSFNHKYFISDIILFNVILTNGISTNYEKILSDICNSLINSKQKSQKIFSEVMVIREKYLTKINKNN